MNETNKNIDVKIPVFIPIIIIAIFVVLIAKFCMPNFNNNDENESVVVSQNEEIVQTSSEEENSEETKAITYTASNGEQYSIIATLNIPSLGIKYPVLSSTSTELLKISLNKYWGAEPNEVGNFVILGHNYENTKFFSKLPNIKIGDIVEITDVDGETLEYTVYETDIIDPYDNECTSQLTEGRTEITLITCYNKGTQRFIAKARVV